MIYPSDVTRALPLTKNQIAELMTPAELLTLTEYEKPQMISPETVPTIHSLFMQRDRIRNLKLAPVKSVEAYKHYHSFRVMDLECDIYSMLGNELMVIALNEFPYMLPPSVNQYICWIRDDVSDDEIQTFLAQLVSRYQVNIDNLILFERPRHATLQLVRGTIQAVRHIHFWTETLLVDTLSFIG